MQRAAELRGASWTRLPPRPQLVRRVLGFPAEPAVLSMHFFAYWHAKPKLRTSDAALFYSTGEDDLAVIAQYYDVPVLSVRWVLRALLRCLGRVRRCCAALPVLGRNAQGMGVDRSARGPPAHATAMPACHCPVVPQERGAAPHVPQ